MLNVSHHIKARNCVTHCGTKLSIKSRLSIKGTHFGGRNLLSHHCILFGELQRIPGKNADKYKVKSFILFQLFIYLLLLFSWIIRALLLSTGLPRWLTWKKICLQCRRPGFDPRVGMSPHLQLVTRVSWCTGHQPVGGGFSKLSSKLSNMR